jgi:hypothetical protein
LAALTTVTILALGHVVLAQAQVVTPSWTAATAPTLHANGKIAFASDRIISIIRESIKSPINVPVSPSSAVECYPCREVSLN